MALALIFNCCCSISTRAAKFHDFFFVQFLFWSDFLSTLMFSYCVCALAIPFIVGKFVQEENITRFFSFLSSFYCRLLCELVACSLHISLFHDIVHVHIKRFCIWYDIMLYIFHTPLHWGRHFGSIAFWRNKRIYILILLFLLVPFST